MQAKKSVIDQKLKELSREAEERDAMRRASKTGYPYLDVKAAPINVEALALIPEVQSEEAKVAPFALKSQGKEIALAFFDPELPKAKEAVADLESRGYKISPCVVSLSSLKHIWNFYKFVPK